MRREQALRVLFCVLDYYPNAAGGAERQARLQAEALKRRGHAVTVVCARTGSEKSGTIAGVRVIRLPRLELPRLRTLSYLAALAVHLGRSARSHDVVHVHLANLQADVAVLVCSLLGTPTYVKVACGGEAGEVRRLGRLARITRWYGLRNASRVQALSEEIAGELSSIGVRRDRVVQIPNGIDLDRFRPASQQDASDARAALRLPPDVPLALFVGRFARYKGILDLLEAWRSRTWGDAQLILLGSEALDAPVPEIRAENGVIVRNWTNDVLPYLDACDVFVYPPHADGMSNALLEAMACGLAVVTTSTGALPPTIEARDAARIVPPKDPGALAGALTDVLGRSSERRRLGAAAAAWAGDYAIGTVVARIEQEYRAVARC